MTGYEIIELGTINATDENKVKAIAMSMLEKGFVGCPILVNVSDYELITGSHRREALVYLNNMSYTCDDEEICDKIEEILNDDNCGEDVSEIVEEWKNDSINAYVDFPYDSLEQVFEGTWVEQYADELPEW